MNSNTSPLRDESQLTQAQIDASYERHCVPTNPYAPSRKYWGRAMQSGFDLARAALEAEVRSLRSQGEPVLYQWRDLSSPRHRQWEECSKDWFCNVTMRSGEKRALSLYASPPSQPIASDVVAASDAQQLIANAESLHHYETADRLRATPSEPAPTLEHAYAEGRQDEREASSDPLAAKTIFRVKRECDALGLDVVGFAWRLQKEWGVSRGLKTGEGPQGHAATSPDVLSRQSPVEADKVQRVYFHRIGSTHQEDHIDIPLGDDPKRHVDDALIHHVHIIKGST